MLSTIVDSGIFMSIRSDTASCRGWVGDREFAYKTSDVAREMRTKKGIAIIIYSAEVCGIFIVMITFIYYFRYLE